ncbi:MAG: potassium-transporting ATPase subunit C [Terriglobales bacterium]
MTRYLSPAFRLMLLFTVLLGIVYPLVVTGLCQWWFPRQANGSLIVRDGHAIGSSLIGQAFARPDYFHGRPSSAGAGYDASASGASNLGPTSAKLILGAVRQGSGPHGGADFDGVSLRVLRYCLSNGIPFTASEPLERFRTAAGALDAVKLIEVFNDPYKPLLITPSVPIPADAVTGSASGLDPDISPANALEQAPRVARARGVTAAQVERLIATHIQPPAFGLLGDARVNVLALNLALDRRFPERPAAGLQ